LEKLGLFEVEKMVFVEHKKVNVKTKKQGEQNSPP